MALKITADNPEEKVTQVKNKKVLRTKCKCHQGMTR